MEVKWEQEIIQQFWNNQTGERYSIGPDREGLGLVEIRFYGSNGEVVHDMSFTKEVWSILRSVEV